MFSFDRHCSALLAEVDLFTSVIAGADMAQAVPTCPKWNLDKLVRHNGGGHRWATTLVESRATEYVKPEYQQSPDDHVAYLLSGAERLISVLGDAGPDAPVWTFTPVRAASFWARRMLHETVVHRADACLALGIGFKTDPEIAADTISEWLWLLSAGSSRPNLPTSNALAGTGETLHFHATDGSGEWFVRLAPDGVVVTEEHAKGDVAVRGPVTDLMLVLMRRLPPSRVEVHGDETILKHWLDSTAF